MNQEVENKQSCSTCGAEVRELRRGRCWTCYGRWAEQRPVGLGACCAVCDERRRDNLRLLEVQGRTLPLCHLCAAKVGKLAVVPYSVEGLRAALRRDRRQVDRREGEPDDRDEQPDRRAVQRRAPGLTGDGSIGMLGRDPALWQLGEAPLDLDLDLGSEVDVNDQDIVEATMVAESPREPAAASGVSSST